MTARYSLTTRLTAFFTLASGLGLVGLGTMVAISIDRHFVELDRDAGQPVDILMGDRPVARGEVVVVEDRLGVTMTEIIKSDRS